MVGLSIELLNPRLNIDQVDSEPQPRKTKKVVRITSPPQSPPSPSIPKHDPLEQRVARARHTSSPPPIESDSSDSDTPTDDPFEKQSDGADDSTEDEGVSRNTKNRSGQMASMSPQVIPPNPFSRTLASMENSAAQQGIPRGSGGKSDATGNSGGKAAMDVDAFKRLLMTGTAENAGPQASALPTTNAMLRPPQVPMGVDSSSSSTDTSSISRTSISDPALDSHVESPRTSYERSDSEDEDERAGLMNSEKKKPPPPKHKHGKSVGTRGPQTVSFSDFTPSISSPGLPQGPGRPGMPRMNSDLNKPLPPPPPYSTSPEQKPKAPWPEPLEQSPPQTPSAETLATSPISTQKTETPVSPPPKKQAPPVPLSRRHSQLRSNAITQDQKRSRSNSSLTLPSQPEEPTQAPLTRTSSSPAPTSTPTSATPTLVSPPPSSTQQKAPPPPPSRRPGTKPLPSPATGSISHDASPSTSNRPSRSASISSTQQIRPHRPSNASSNSGIGGAGASGLVAPPPPPPRRTSQRTSLEGSRPAMASVFGASGSRRGSVSSGGGERRSSMGSLDQVAEASQIDEEDTSDKAQVIEGSEERGNAKNAVEMMKGMDELQKEVDALIAKAGKGSS
ncbi:MAG: hypothetical protein M1820_003902 [Bogoriella megaspora]|nr:MAG: hypothetical protein M1820_003902 [Bogoriella megaspora]